MKLETDKDDTNDNIRLAAASTRYALLNKRTCWCLIGFIYTKLDQNDKNDLHYISYVHSSLAKLCQTQSSSQMEDANARFLQICEAYWAKIMA